MSIEWSNVRVKLSALRPWEQNPRHITRKQAERLAESFSEFGQVETVAVGPDGDVYNGHQRLSVLLKLHGSEYEVDARKSSRPLTDDERKKLVVFLHAGAVGGWSWDALSGWEAADLMQWGFDGDTLQAWKGDIAALGNLIESETPEPADAEPQIDRAEELREKWKTETGQTWKFGEHTLYCGPASEARIKCEFAVYDPPFDWSAQQQETALSWVSWKNCVLLGLRECFPLAVRADCNHWWVWDSGMARFGGKGYKPMSGCAIALNFGDKRRFYEASALAALDRANITHYDWTIQVVKIQDHLGGREYKHEKPYPLADYIVSLYSQAGEVVGDPFAGSGTFLIACENLARKYHGSEINPQNCAVILDRFYRTFGIMPTPS